MSGKSGINPMVRLDPATFAGLKAASEKTMVRQKDLAMLAIREWLKANHPDCHKIVLAEIAKTKKG